MNDQTIRLVFVAFFVLELGWDLLLTLLNLRHVRSHAEAVPEAFASVIDQETYARSVSYTLVHGRFGIADGVFSAVVILVVLFSGALGWIESLTRSLPVPDSIQGILLIAAVGLVFWVLQLPFALYSTFGIEARFGFNKTMPRLWIVDTLKGLGITVVLGVPLLLALFWFMRATGALWWIWAFVAMTAFQLVMNILSPLVIAPLFNKFSPFTGRRLEKRDSRACHKARLSHKGHFRRRFQPSFTSLECVLHRPGKIKTNRPIRHARELAHGKRDRVGSRSRNRAREAKSHQKGDRRFHTRVAHRILDHQPSPALATPLSGIRIHPG